MNFFPLLLSVITNPHLLRSLAGLLMLAGTWYLCTKLGLSSNWRLLVMLGVLLLVAVVQVLLTVRGRRKRNRAAADLETSLIMEADQSIVSAESGQKRAREDARRELVAAIDVLKRSQLADGRGGRAALYVLPWYLVLGTQYSGKSSLIRNSGLQPPDKGPGELRGIGASSNCEWWFTNHAVLLEADHRFASVSGAKAAERDWSTFLSMLRKQRPRVALNGIVIAVSAADLMQGSPAELEAQARLLRRRLDAISDELKLVFPVYLVVTKLDLAQGCEDFFAGLTGAGGEQIFGCTLRAANLRGSDFEKTFAAELEALYQNLCRRRQMRLVLEEHRARRDGTFLFPLQLRGLGGSLQRFAKVLCEANVYGRNPLLRGFYFTSVGGEGRVADLVRNELSRVLSLPAPAIESVGAGQPLFLRGFFRKVLVLDRDIARPTSGAARRMRHVRRVMQAAALVGLIVAGISVWELYTNNLKRVRDMQEMTKEVSAVAIPENQRVRDIDPTLAKLDGLRGKLESLDKAPLFNLGFYRVDDLADGARRVYLDRFVSIVAEPLVTDIQYSLKRDPLDGTEEQWREGYTVLKMLQQSVVVDSTRVIKVALKQATRTPNAFGVSAQERLEKHLKFALRHVDSLRIRMEAQGLMNEDARIKTLALRYFSNGTGNGTYYDDVINGINARYPALAFNLGKLARKTSSLDIRDGSAAAGWGEVPFSYTMKGWREQVSKTLGSNQKLSEESQVLESVQQNLSGSRDILMKKYAEQYINHWQRFLSAVTLAPPSTLAGASILLSEVTEKDSPYQDLLAQAEQNLNFEKLKDDLDVEVTNELNRITEAFAALHAALKSGAGENNKRPFDDLLGTVDVVAKHVDKRKGVEQAAKAAKFTLGVFAGPADEADNPIGESLDMAKKVSGVNERAGNSDCNRALESYLKQPALAAWQAYLHETEAHLDQQWKSVCDGFSGLEGKYPLVRNSRDDVSLALFGEFFREGGVLTSFVKDQLRPYVADSGNVPTEKYDCSLGLTEAAQKALNAGIRLRQAFWAEGVTGPAFSFEVRPGPSTIDSPDSPMLAGTTDFYFNGVKAHGEAGTDPKKLFSWPPEGKKSEAEIKATITDTISGKELECKVTGGSDEWALFRLIDKAERLERGQKFTMSWRLDVPGQPDTKVVVPFEFSMKRDDHAFLRSSTEFSCPVSLFQ
jgi:type VI secretion system protein ImpL